MSINHKDFVAAAFTGLLSNSHIISHLDKDARPGMTDEEKRAARRENAKDVADYAILLGEVLAQRYFEES